MQQNNTETIATHDVYTEGEAKDDQVQNHTHQLREAYSATAAQGNPIAMFKYTETAYNSTSTGSMSTGRSGTVTRGKRKAVFFYIKATAGLPENQQENVLNAAKSYVDGKVIGLRKANVEINSQYFSVTHNLNKLGNAYNVINYYKSGGYMQYIFTVQEISANTVVVYVRRADGQTITDGTTIDVSITIVPA